ncbi:MAG: aspartate-alanine antiporter [Deltaproteobacteria bacterium]|nr:aspartate-alanine antiporter [Candidatus Tharpella aukensis]
MEIILEQLRTYPLMALFLTLGLGYFAGKFRIKSFELGGIAGTLLVAVLIGQFGGIAIAGDVKSFFFSLFIFMVGYIGGPQFFSSFNKSSIKYLIAGVSMTVMGLIAVVAISIWAGLDKGLAAGLAAGGLTQSAIIGTAGNAIDQLGLAKTVAEQFKTNVAVGYSITYIFGSLGPILMVSFIPILMKWDIRKEAIKLAEKLGGGAKQLAEDEFYALSRSLSRAFTISKEVEFCGQKVGDVEKVFNADIVIEAIVRNDKALEVRQNETLQPDDLVITSGVVRAYAEVDGRFGKETDDIPDEFNLVEERRKVVITNKEVVELTLRDLHDKATVEQRHGVSVTEIYRAGHRLETLPHTLMHLGDELTLVGKKEDLDRATRILGYATPKASFTDFAVFGIAAAIGYLIGEISFTISGTSVALGSGLGCLVSGLVLGFLRTKHPKFGNINIGAALFLQSFGLAVFVGIVGLNAGAPALEAIMVGGRSANPGFAALLDKTGNSMGTSTFTIGYAVANIFLTLWGPIIVAIIK